MNETKRSTQAGRIMRRAAACLLASFACLAQAATVPGTTITNQATATGQQGGAPVQGGSNIVTLTVGTPPGIAFSATLEANRAIASVTPGSTVYARHVLTNTGSNPDAYTL